MHNQLFNLFPGPPVAVGMSIDVASIDMVSEVNMVSGFTSILCVFAQPHNAGYIPTGFPRMYSRRQLFSSQAIR